jgi:hypothetical protein
MKLAKYSRFFLPFCLTLSSTIVYGGSSKDEYLNQLISNALIEASAPFAAISVEHKFDDTSHFFEGELEGIEARLNADCTQKMLKFLNDTPADKSVNLIPTIRVEGQIHKSTGKSVTYRDTYSGKQWAEMTYDVYDNYQIILKAKIQRCITSCEKTVTEFAGPKREYVKRCVARPVAELSGEPNIRHTGTSNGKPVEGRWTSVNADRAY